MLDFANGWAWFAAGFGTTLVTGAAVALLAFCAERSARRRAARHSS